MSKAILNKRDKMMWDNSFKPDGVNDTLDLVSEHIEDIVEDHREGIAKTVSYIDREYKEIVNITFTEASEALNIDFEKEYAKLIVIYQYSGISGAPATSKKIYLKTNYGTQEIATGSYDGPSDRSLYHEIKTLQHTMLMDLYYQASAHSSTWQNFIGKRLIPSYNAGREYVLKGLQASINIPVGAQLFVYGVEA